jgi:glycosyltransferase involved in cell wall biosynthesis
MTMKTVFISFFPAYPPTSGASSVTYNSARHASGDRLLIQMDTKEVAHPGEDGLEIRTLAWPEERWFKLANLPGRVREIGDWVRRSEPEVVVLEGASWAMYHLLLLGSLRRACGPSTRIWYHGHNVEYVLRRQRHSRMVSELTRWAEARLLRGVDRVFAVSEVDRRQLRALYGVEAELWPNGVDVTWFGGVSDEAVALAGRRYGLHHPTVLFMGMYAYAPNREAIDFLVEETLPRVRRHVPDARLLILGGDVPHERDWLVAPGKVAHTELPAIVRAATVGVAPIFSGSGTRLKILEYLAAGLPVVSTPKGAEGLSIDDASGLRLAEAEVFAEAVTQVLSDPDRARSQASVGQRTIEARYDWPSILRGVGLREAEKRQVEERQAEKREVRP